MPNKLSKNKLSVVLATYNEAQNLATCLESIRDIADEIVVVDGQSTDQTGDIAAKFKARVITTSNKANFHINKQMAIDAARYPLILQLDADEVVDPQLSDFIVKIKNQQLSDLPSAWWIKRKNFFLTKFLTKGGQYPDPVIRLLQKGAARLPQIDVHEQMSVVGEVAIARGHLLHYSYPDFQTYLKKFNTYTSFAAQKLVKTKFNPGFSSGISYLVLKPTVCFLSLAFRHKGILDGVAGLIFALMSAFHFPITYLKAVELLNHHAHST